MQKKQDKGISIKELFSEECGRKRRYKINSRSIVIW